MRILRSDLRSVGGGSVMVDEDFVELPWVKFWDFFQ